MIVLSSGTTSVPKGVIHTHRGFIENARTNLYMYQGILPRDRSLVPLSTAFIGCYNGWFPFLNAGACTIFMEHFDLDELPRRASAERATHVFLTPTLWRRILNAEDADANFRSVRLIGFAAEPMDATTLKRLRERISPNVVQIYGSTEIGAAATCITRRGNGRRAARQRRPAAGQRRPARRRARRQAGRRGSAGRNRRGADLLVRRSRPVSGATPTRPPHLSSPMASGAGGARATSAASMPTAISISKAAATI